MTNPHVDLAALAWQRWRVILVNPPTPITDPAAAMAVYDTWWTDAARRPSFRREGDKAGRHRSIWAALVALMEPGSGLIDAHPGRLAAAAGAGVTRRAAARACSWARRRGLLARLGTAPVHHHMHVIVENCRCLGYCQVHPWPYHQALDEPDWRTLRQGIAGVAASSPPGEPPPGHRWVCDRAEVTALAAATADRVTAGLDPTQRRARMAVLGALRGCITSDGTIRVDTDRIAHFAAGRLHGKRPPTRADVQRHLRALIKLGALGRISRGWDEPWLAFIAPTLPTEPCGAEQ